MELSVSGVEGKEGLTLTLLLFPLRSQVEDPRGAQTRVCSVSPDWVLEGPGRPIAASGGADERWE